MPTPSTDPSDPGGRMWDSRPLLDSIRKVVDAYSRLSEETRAAILETVDHEQEGS